MESPVVSVILPCYNASRHLRQCLDSILCQTLGSIEVLCVDDGSTDDTLSILQHYQSTDSRVRIIRQENAGAGAARNAGLAISSGTYLSFLDADDFFEPDMLEKAVATAEEYRADYVVFRSDRYYPSKEEFREIPWSLRTCDLPPYMPFTYRQLTDNVFLTFVGWAWDKLFRRSFVEEHRLYFQEQRTTNDMLFVFSALICAKRIAVRQEILAHQRRESGDSLSVTREKSWHCFYDALIALRQRLIRENVYWELEQDFINYSLHFCLWHLNSLAEPTRTRLKQKLCGEWFAELGIADKPESYFYSFSEYIQYLNIAKRQYRIRHFYFPKKTLQDNAYYDRIADQTGFNDLLIETNAIFGINIEFDRLRDYLMQNQEIWNKTKYIYWSRKYHSYQLIYNQIGEHHKKEYRNRMIQEFKRAIQLGEIHRNYFSFPEWICFCRIGNNGFGIVNRIRRTWLGRGVFSVVPGWMLQQILLRFKKNKRS